MAIIAGQRVLRKGMAADVIREWAPINREGRMTVAEPARRVQVSARHAARAQS